jgi:RNA polymerase sigma-70 factor (ECF subfamily)
VTSATPDTTSHPDEQLVRALVHDLDAGFIAMFHAYRPVVFSTALRITGAWADAEDLTAESFLRAYRALSDFPPDRIRALRPRSWLLTITLNLWRNHQRALARRPPPTPLDQAVDPPDLLADVEQSVGRRESDRELAALLTALPPDQRVAVVLRHVIGLPIAEIADVLGKSEGTVKSQIARGLRRLRALFPTPVDRTARPSLEVRT